MQQNGRISSKCDSYLMEMCTNIETYINYKKKVAQVALVKAFID